MTNFHEVRLPARLAFGSTGGIERRTEVVTLASGHERRSTPWAQGRRRWLIGAGVRSLDDMEELLAFFEARRGRLFGFRFKDFADWKSCAPSGAITPDDQRIGAGDGERRSFQLVKRYGPGSSPGQAVERTIAKPVAGSVRVAVGAVELGPGGFQVDAATGMVTLAAAPAPGAAVSAGFVFDAPVRFDSDRLDVTLESFEAGRIAAVPLVEVRV
jgi:uncharacterized protein (TIGR02217 family)